jgi:hypothetical protein
VPAKRYPIKIKPKYIKLGDAIAKKRPKKKLK